MRSPIRKELIACFEREFKPRFPQFAPALKDRRFCTWAWKIAPNLTFFIGLQAFQREDQFAIEVAWSENGEFPWHGIGQIEADKPLGRERVGVLFKTGPREVTWDLAPEATAGMQRNIEGRVRGELARFDYHPPIELVLPRVEPIVRDAIEKLEQYGVPLFRRVAEARKLDWDGKRDITNIDAADSSW
jgi:hypothetical protein